jgi:hypothetical protein
MTNRSKIISLLLVVIAILGIWRYTATPPSESNRTITLGQPPTSEETDLNLQSVDSSNWVLSLENTSANASTNTTIYEDESFISLANGVSVYQLNLSGNQGAYSVSLLNANPNLNASVTSNQLTFNNPTSGTDDRVGLRIQSGGDMKEVSLIVILSEVASESESLQLQSITGIATENELGAFPLGYTTSGGALTAKTTDTLTDGASRSISFSLEGTSLTTVNDNGTPIDSSDDYVEATLIPSTPIRSVQGFVFRTQQLSNSKIVSGLIEETEAGTGVSKINANSLILSDSGGGTAGINASSVMSVEGTDMRRHLNVSTSGAAYDRLKLRLKVPTGTSGVIPVRIYFSSIRDVSNNSLLDNGAETLANINSNEALELNIPFGFNNAPTAINPSPITTVEDTPVLISLDGTDPDLDPMTFSITSDPTSGTLNPPLTGSAGTNNVTYTPNLDFVGADSFIFIVNDGNDDSSPVTVNITVTANQAPTANSQSVTVNEDSLGTNTNPPTNAITLSGSDPESDTLTFTAGTATNGTVGGSGANVTYQPDPNYNGQDSFTFTVDDGSNAPVTGTVTITVTAIDDPPEADAQSVTVNEDSSGTNTDPPTNAITLTGSDPDQDAITAYTYTQPSNGTVAGTGPNVTYEPNPDYSGTDSFTFTVTANGVTSSPATVSITVTNIDDPPEADAQSVTVNEDSSGTNTDPPTNAITLTGSDPDQDAITAYTYTQPSNGTVLGTGPNVTYEPNPDYNGQDSFTFTVTANGVESSPAIVTITVTGANDDPVAALVHESSDRTNNYATGSTSYVTGHPATFDASGSTDPDIGDTLSYAWTITNASSTVIFSNVPGSEVSANGVTVDVATNGPDKPIITFDTASMPAGTARVMVTVSDQNSASDTAQLDIEVFLLGDILTDNAKDSGDINKIIDAILGVISLTDNERLIGDLDSPNVGNGDGWEVDSGDINAIIDFILGGG